MAQNQTATQSPSWIMDTGASHHISQDLQQLTLANSYPGADQVVVGDGTGLKITHTGNSIIHTPVKPLYLKQVLCVPKIQSNLLSVSKLCQSNTCSVEFFPNHFVVKDLNSGQALLQVTPSPVQTLPTFDSPIHSIINVPREPTNTAPVTSLQDQVGSICSAVPVPTQTPTCYQLPESPVLSLENAPSPFPTPAPSMLESQSPIQSSVPESTSASVPVSELPRLKSNLETCSITNNNYDAPNTECIKPAVRDPIVTRSHHNIFKPKKTFVATKHELQENLEPSTITQALKISHWRDACSAEFNALMNNGTWTLVLRDTHTNLVGFGFSTSLSDPSLFIYNKYGVRAFLLVYVDDLLLTGAKTTTTPLCMTTPLKLEDGSAPADAKMFRSIIGALQYITLTRPDLSFAVNKLSQFMHQPTELHVQQLKRVLRSS
ncbi:hypothetical protein KIW84_046014 [Lathyrus oleraceus]|uniref:Retrovirus-related Pol polyprotein from transposon TNT 1-94-like beta-barrel domain-containing protein n=1 Tax=Pisum sativum TaxID=3888 RepID=A0A9D5AXZ7_PEA|nr:hypothetical protein KIW84_046014 [Pisum sativum]